VLYEITLIIIEFFIPIDQIGSKIDFLSRPETCFGFLVVAPDVIVLDREEDEPIGVVFKDRFRDNRVLGQNFFNGSLDFCGLDLAFGCLVHILLCSLPCGNGFSFFPLGPLEFPQ
jgi:hypothetical protein